MASGPKEPSPSFGLRVDIADRVRLPPSPQVGAKIAMNHLKIMRF